MIATARHPTHRACFRAETWGNSAAACEDTVRNETVRGLWQGLWKAAHAWLLRKPISARFFPWQWGSPLRGLSRGLGGGGRGRRVVGWPPSRHKGLVSKPLPGTLCSPHSGASLGRRGLAELRRGRRPRGGRGEVSSSGRQVTRRKQGSRGSVALPTGCSRGGSHRPVTPAREGPVRESLRGRGRPK